VRRFELAVLAPLLPVVLAAQQPRPRARDVGLTFGSLTPGPLDAITDVAGVRVGQVTVTDGDSVNTGVTAILPHGGNLFREKVPAAIAVGNGFGKLTGIAQVRELGELESPVVLTCTLCVPRVADATLSWLLALPGNEDVRSINVVVGETNDGTLNAIRARPVREEHVLAALRGAREGPVEEGSVGAGRGTIAFGWKGGIGTASRRSGGYTLGVLVQTNYGGHLILGGVPVWRELNPLAQHSASGSCMIVVATDAPLTARDLKRLAARAIFGLARTGSSYANGSGDFAIAFSTAPSARLKRPSTRPASYEAITTDALNPLFEMALEATEEAVDNSLLQATPVRSRFGSAAAIPIEKLKDVLAKYGLKP